MDKLIVNWEDKFGEVPLGGNEPPDGVLVTYDDGSTEWLSAAAFEALSSEAFAEAEDSEEEEDQ